MFDPHLILDDANKERMDSYEARSNLFYGNHYLYYDIDIFEYKLKAEDYICFDILQTAIELKTDLTFLNDPKIEFENKQLLNAWDELNQKGGYLEKIKQAVTYNSIYGNNPIKIGTELNPDPEVVIYNLDPKTWYPTYSDYNLNKQSKTNTIVFCKELKDKTKVYLCETHEPGKIIFEGFLLKGKDFEAVPIMEYFGDIFEHVLVENNFQRNDIKFGFKTNITYSTIQVMENQSTNLSYFGISDFTLPVISKLGAINKYANLADFLITVNSQPPIQLSKDAMALLAKHKEDAIYELDERYIGLPTDFNTNPVRSKRHIYAKSLLESLQYRKLMQNAILPDTGRGENKFLNNPFDTDKIELRIEKLMQQLFDELDISEVFYNPNSIGSKSGVALKLLMTNTLNAINSKQNYLKKFLPKLIFTILELAYDNKIINIKPEMPSVSFTGELLTEEQAKLEYLITKYNNQLATKVDVLKELYDMTEEQAEAKEQEIGGLILDNQATINQGEDNRELPLPAPVNNNS